MNMMANEQLILLAILLPLIASVLIVLTDKKPNLRETISLVASFGLLATVLSLLPSVLAGEQPSVILLEMYRVYPLSLNLNHWACCLPALQPCCGQLIRFIPLAICVVTKRNIKPVFISALPLPYRAPWVLPWQEI